LGSTKEKKNRKHRSQPKHTNKTGSKWARANKKKKKGENVGRPRKK